MLNDHGANRSTCGDERDHDVSFPHPPRFGLERRRAAGDRPDDTSSRRRMALASGESPST